MKISYVQAAMIPVFFFIEIELRILLCVSFFREKRGKKAKKRVLPQLSPY